MMNLRLITDHGTGSIVHWTDCTAQEGEPNAVLGLATAVKFHSANTLVGQHVGIAVIQTAGMEGSVEIYHYMMLGSFLSHTLVEVDHPLVLTVHKVYLCPDNAPFLKFLKEIHVMFYSEPRQPDPDSHR